MLHSPFILSLRLSIIKSSLSRSSSTSSSAVKSSGGGKVPERKGKQKDTLCLLFRVSPYING